MLHSGDWSAIRNTEKQIKCHQYVSAFSEAVTEALCLLKSFSVLTYFALPPDTEGCHKTQSKDFPLYGTLSCITLRNASEGLDIKPPSEQVWSSCLLGDLVGTFVDCMKGQAMRFSRMPGCLMLSWEQTMKIWTWAT